MRPEYSPQDSICSPHHSLSKGGFADPSRQRPPGQYEQRPVEDLSTQLSREWELRQLRYFGRGVNERGIEVYIIVTEHPHPHPSLALSIRSGLPSTSLCRRPRLSLPSLLPLLPLLSLLSLPQTPPPDPLLPKTEQHCIILANRPPQAPRPPSRQPTMSR
jgi:hypothetical protein